MPERPWMKFYPADWQADQALRMCSLAARGLWVECMAIMHRADPYGHLVVNGQPPTDAQLAVLVGASPGQVPELLGELATAGVFSRTRKGAIYSRRMTRDDKKAKTARKNGKQGGNPKLSNITQNPAWDKGPVNGQDKTQIPEARYQKDKHPQLPNGSSPPSRGTRLPSDWRPSETDREFARSKGLSDERIDELADEFRDYWSAKTGRDSTKRGERGWAQTWANRVRYVTGTGGVGHRAIAPRGQPPRNRQGPASFARAAARVAAKAQDG